MYVLIGCETSGEVRRAFRRSGHNAYSCDLLPSDDNSCYHIVDDVRNVMNSGHFELGIFHPTCTFMCNSGVSHLYKDIDRWKKLIDSAVLFRDILNCDIPKICVENPIMHKYAVKIVGRRQDQVIQPWMFGHGETKATCLWLKGLPLLKPTDVVEGREQRLHKLPPSKDRWKIRSRTFPGIAKAMAEQWGCQ